ncbi:ABC transporter ATP-binding protein/permease [Ruminococcus sp. OA3]|uniref:ABC transporter ATP-binding protein n=1 Tax=Ruminococcus sp. OA3 TaxID=2914164 RepID=UPI001F068079|nr:ABC transporter ATP-binding protein [Ruminococcus sp. OA3]MCH1983132.1 ABC transporter ATP-binding protein/permease [Ruminococcus sp. OA3]
MFKKVMEYAGENRKLTYAAAAAMLAGIVVSVIPFWFIYQLMAPLLEGETMDPGYIAWRLAAIAVCAVLYAVLYIKGLALSHESAYKTLKNLRISLQGKLEKQPLGTIQEKGVGTVKKMFIDDIESIELLLAHALPEGFANLTVPAVIFLAMFFVDWKLALLSLCSLPLGLLSMGAMYKSGMSKMGPYYGAAQKMNNTIVEYINGMEVVKVFNRDGESYRRFETDVKNYRDFTLAWFKACWPWMALYTSVLPCVALVTLPLGTCFVLMGWSALPDLALILCMSFGIGAPLVRALGFMSTMPQVNFKINALEEMMAEPPLQQTDAPFAGNGRGIEFENIRFAYREDEVLHNVSLNIPEGSMTALVGESGSGKSTLAKLLVHFYDVSDGSIRLGGQDIRSMSVEALNDQISYVAQEQFLFNMSLQENIRLGNLHASDDEVMEAALKAQCGEFLKRLPQGIHTMAGDGGKQLSGGERQRISLARALLKNAPVVVLDEATAFMDPENEEKMNEAIAEVIRGKTVIVIAHRLHSIVNADQICVLDKGNLLATGSHAQLLENCPQYARLWNAAQLSASWRVSTAVEGERKGGVSI